MGMSTDFQSFKSLAGIDQFFQEIKATGQPWTEMFVPPKVGSKAARLLQRTYIGHPEKDFELLDNVLTSDRFAGRWTIEPVPNLAEYRANTDEHTYRVTLRKDKITLYRKLMVEDKKFFPLPVFHVGDKAKDYFWISGRHRSEALKSFGAIFSVVMKDLTEREIIYITDVTNEWHQETWDENERALMALGYTMYGHPIHGDMTQKQALALMKLPPDDYAPLYGAMLYKQHSQGPTDRRLIESHEAGKGGHGGRPVGLKNLGENVMIFGQDSILEFPLESWLYLKEPEAKAVLSALRGGANSRGFASDRNTWTRTNVREIVRGKLRGNDCNERWKDFQSRIQMYRDHITSVVSGVSGPTDDRIWMNYITKYAATNDTGLLTIKRELSKPERERSAEVVARLNRIFT